MDRLPDTRGLKNEVVVQRVHRNSYDHAVRTVGVRLVEVGGLGHPTPRPTEPWELAAAITRRTACVLWPVMAAPDALPLTTVARIAHDHDVPVLVDAAAALPPPENLRRFITEGADLVTFSGGKALRGPQASGILAGRADNSSARWRCSIRIWTCFRRRGRGGTLLEQDVVAGPPGQGIGRVAKGRDARRLSVSSPRCNAIWPSITTPSGSGWWKEHTAWRVTWPACAMSRWPALDGPEERFPSVRLDLDESPARHHGHRRGQRAGRRRPDHRGWAGPRPPGEPLAQSVQPGHLRRDDDRRAAAARGVDAALMAWPPPQPSPVLTHRGGNMQPTRRCPLAMRGAVQVGGVEVAGCYTTSVFMAGGGNRDTGISSGDRGGRAESRSD